MQDPVRSFTGRDKYKRPLWTTEALDNPVVVRINVLNLVVLYHLSLQSSWFFYIIFSDSSGSFD